MDAARALAGLDHELGLHALERLVDDPTLTNQGREDAARALARRDRGHEALERLANETVLKSSDRVDAARALAGLNRERGLNALERLVHDHTLTYQGREDAESVLKRLRDGNLQEAAEELALAEGARRQHEWVRQRVGDPFPLAVRFGNADPGLHDHWARIRGALPGADPGPLTLVGRLHQIVEVYRSIPSRRLVVLGAAGSGKSILTMRFVLDWLGHRTSGDPVPVIFSLRSWDPTTVSLQNWMADHLVRDYGGLAALAAHGRNLAGALVYAGWILPVLDGFDEIASGLQHHVLKELDRTDTPFVLTSRLCEYTKAVENYCLPRAAVIELADLTVDDLTEYLPRTARPGSGGSLRTTVWEPVLSALCNEPRSAGAANLAQVLTTPLMVTMARNIYSDTSLREPAELLDSTRFGTPESLQEHLLATLVPAAYHHRSTDHDTGRSRRHWNSDHAQRWLGYLAAHLNVLDTRDLAWWQLGASMNLIQRTLVIGLLAALAFGVTTTVGNILVDLVTTSHGLGFAVARGLAAGVLHGLVAGLGVGLVYRFMSRGVAVPTHVRVLIFDRSLQPQTFLPRFILGLVAGFAAALVLLLVAKGVVPEPGLHGGLAGALVFGPGIGLGTGLVLGILAWLEVPIDIRSAVSPVTLLSTNRRNMVFYLLVWASVFGLGGGFATGFVAGPVRGLLGGLMFGLTAAFGGGIGYGLSFTAWGQWVGLARIWLPLTGRLPWSLIAFLDDACRRGVLRRAGAVYQFRYARLQNHLATPEAR